MFFIQTGLSIMTVNSAPNLPVIQPAQIADSGKLRIGGACRILPATKPEQIADSGRIRIGGACRILPPNRGHD